MAPFKSPSAMEQAKLVVKEAHADQRLGAGCFAHYEYDQQGRSHWAPVCSLGHLAWAIEDRHERDFIGAVERHYGLDDDECDAVIRINDNTATHNRATEVLALFDRIGLED